MFADERVERAQRFSLQNIGRGDSICLLLGGSLPGQRVRSFQFEEVVARIFFLQLARQRERLRKPLLMFVQSQQQQLGIVTLPMSSLRHALEGLKAPLLLPARAGPAGPSFWPQPEGCGG